MGTHFSILAWRIPWTVEPGGLQSMGSQRVRHNLAIKPSTAHNYNIVSSVCVCVYVCVCVCVSAYAYT